MKNIIFFGDWEILSKEIPDSSIDLILTDPPWWYKKLPTHFHTMSVSSPPTHGLVGKYKSYKEFCEKMFEEFKRVIKPSGNVCIMANLQMFPTLLVASAKSDLKFKKFFVWCIKDFANPLVHNCFHIVSYFVFIFGGKKTYFDEKEARKFTPKLENFIIIERSEMTKHPFIFQGRKPNKLLELFVLSFSPPGGIVYDPFLGSGSIIKPVVLNNRRLIGSEINDEAETMIRHEAIESGGVFEFLKGETVKLRL
uniref:Methyltransferase n=1 Tax=candidate division WOR-3 bacterium TaxID=2052148 RepID=A0A7V4E2E5_UNCW3